MSAPPGTRTPNPVSLGPRFALLLVSARKGRLTCAYAVRRVLLVSRPCAPVPVQRRTVTRRQGTVLGAFDGSPNRRQPRNPGWRPGMDHCDGCPAAVRAAPLSRTASPVRPAKLQAHCSEKESRKTSHLPLGSQRITVTGPDRGEPGLLTQPGLPSARQQGPPGRLRSRARAAALERGVADRRHRGYLERPRHVQSPVGPMTRACSDLGKSDHPPLEVGSSQHRRSSATRARSGARTKNCQRTS
jgi:hypothetical protein